MALRAPFSYRFTYDVCNLPSLIFEERRCFRIAHSFLVLL